MIIGLEDPDDAGVYKITDDIALIQTVDFFTPIVDDPYWFGQIAAANALSDVYAMGGIPKTAMNLVAFPLKQLDFSILKEILRGGLDKIKEAGCCLVGGHSIEDKELKYGLSVTGIVHPDKIITKKDLKIGDLLILTKPIGTGIINTAIKGGIASKEIIETVTYFMAMLNKDAASIMREFPVDACTDITGFGLIGHLCEMIADNKVGIELWADKIPFFSEALEYARKGFVPSGSYKNRDFRISFVDFAPNIDPIFCDLLFDAQTSGGLLIAIKETKAFEMVKRLKEKGINKASIIGKVMDKPKGRIVVR